ncbi:SAM-dependent methyltransferase [Actinorhabdospora filicis]|nr:class I SAM-dependent methyltransferase [Actinorhabdospora filicis]
MIPTPGDGLVFHGPLSEARAASLITRLTAEPRPRTILDLGCGRGELMLRLLSALPDATGTGVDLHAPDLAAGAATASARGLGDRVRFLEESATNTEHGPADLVLCLGSSHALTDLEPPAHTAAALVALRALVNPGGRVLLGESHWTRTPTLDELAHMWPDASASEHGYLADLTDAAVAAGFRVQWVETATLDEWDAFESAYLAACEVWLASNEDEKLRERVTTQRSRYLRGYRGVMGQAYLTLVAG